MSFALQTLLLRNLATLLAASPCKLPSGPTRRSAVVLFRLVGLRFLQVLCACLFNCFSCCRCRNGFTRLRVPCSNSLHPQSVNEAETADLEDAKREVVHFVEACFELLTATVRKNCRSEAATEDPAQASQQVLSLCLPTMLAVASPTCPRENAPFLARPSY